MIVPRSDQNRVRWSSKRVPLRFRHSVTSKSLRNETMLSGQCNATTQGTLATAKPVLLSEDRLLMPG